MANQTPYDRLAEASRIAQVMAQLNDNFPNGCTQDLLNAKIKELTATLAHHDKISAELKTTKAAKNAQSAQLHRIISKILKHVDMSHESNPGALTAYYGHAKPRKTSKPIMPPTTPPTTPGTATKPGTAAG